MEMFLTVLLLSLLASAASAAMFAAATRGVEDEVRYLEVRKPATFDAIPEQFFAADVAAATRSAVPIEVLLLQIERHVRLERAAGESFLQTPNATSLHCRTTSPLVN